MMRRNNADARRNGGIMERRIYSRLESGMQCLIYKDNKEMNGIVDNVSESGVAILIRPEDIKCEIDIGDRVNITGLDADMVIQFHTEVVRFAEKDGYRLIGAKIVNRTEIEPYINKKRVEMYIKSIYSGR